jgi:hypothetical protein
MALNLCKEYYVNECDLMPLKFIKNKILLSFRSFYELFSIG